MSEYAVPIVIALAVLVVALMAVLQKVGWA